MLTIPFVLCHSEIHRLYQDVLDLRTRKAPDQEIVALLEHQAETWTRLVKDEAALRKSIDEEFKKVLDVEDRVKKARGTYPNVAALVSWNAKRDTWGLMSSPSSPCSRAFVSALPKTGLPHSRSTIGASHVFEKVQVCFPRRKG